jgi:hypothetical protein
MLHTTAQSSTNECRRTRKMWAVDWSRATNPRRSWRRSIGCCGCHSDGVDFVVTTPNIPILRPSRRQNNRFVFGVFVCETTPSADCLIGLSPLKKISAKRRLQRVWKKEFERKKYSAGIAFDRPILVDSTLSCRFQQRRQGPLSPCL